MAMKVRRRLSHMDTRNLAPFTGVTRRWFVRVEHKVQDCWVGVFWKRDYPWSFDVWVCIVPMLPIHFGWQAQIPDWLGEELRTAEAELADWRKRRAAVEGCPNSLTVRIERALLARHPVTLHPQRARNYAELAAFVVNGGS